ncbi:MAG: pilus assembly protein PilM [Candidatus Eremiobacteraeota bacterium]|nr:pilus assembly protein PilM [Candidatus Eremiobacteraeota bacterium]
MRQRSLPLGIDIGSTHVRIAAATFGAEGPVVTGVATREIPAGYATSGEIAEPEYVAALVEQAAEDLHTRERRCVACVGAPEAVLCAVHLPPMSATRRKRAALVQARTHIDYLLSNALVIIAPVYRERSLFALGVVRKASLQSRLLTLKKAGMKVIAFDHEALAFRRVFPNCGTLVDIGHERSSVHCYGTPIPRTAQVIGGGAQMTRAIESELAIDAVSAEKRKCQVGTRGAGDSIQAALIRNLGLSIDSLREPEHEARGIVLTGNGSRLKGLAAELEAKTGVRIEKPPARVVSTHAYPIEVVQANIADWSLALGLSIWGCGSTS